MNIFKSFKNFFKKSHNSSLINDLGAYDNVKNSSVFLKEGYAWNAIVFSCVSKIAQACAELEIESVNEKKEYVEKPTESILLLKKPNLFQSQNTFIESAIIYHQVTGSAFVEGVMSGNKVIELNVIPSHEVTIESYNTNNPYYPISYTWNSNGNLKKWELDPIQGGFQTQNKTSKLLHFKIFNPLNPKESLSPLSAGAYAVDAFNKGMAWNNSLLNNHAKPSSILTTDQVLEPNQREQIGKYLKSLSGSKNTAKTAIFEGGLKWQQTALSPLDMDFINILTKSTEQIAMIYKIPIDLVLGNSTYANLKESKEMFYIDTVIPLMNRFLKELSLFIEPKSPNYMRVDMDDIIALEGMRERLFNRNIKGVSGSILTPNEARESIGYDPIEGIADDLLTSGGTKLLDDIGAEIVNELQSLNNAQNNNNNNK